MAKSNALVPVSFFAPVQSGAGSPFKFISPRRGVLIPQPLRPVAPDTYEALTYRRDGYLLADNLVGTLVDMYI